MFARDLNPEDGPVRVRRPRHLDYFSHGEISRRCFDALRGGATLPASDIARTAMTDKGLNYDADRHMRIKFTCRITIQHNSMAHRGDIQKIGSGHGVRWRLATGERGLAPRPPSAILSSHRLPTDELRAGVERDDKACAGPDVDRAFDHKMVSVFAISRDCRT